MAQPFIGRYVALGDSLSEGIGDVVQAGRERGFAGLLAGLLRQESPELTFTNLGVGGARTADVLHRQLDRALALQPDLVTLVVGANDVPSTALGQFERDYHALVSRLRGGVSGVIAIATIPNFAHLLPPHFASYRNAMVARVDGFNRIIAQAAATNNALLADLQHGNAAEDPRNLSSDGVHPNARGYRAMAARFAETLNQAGFTLPVPPIE